jgi:hypothetical protein
MAALQKAQIEYVLSGSIEIDDRHTGILTTIDLAFGTPEATLDETLVGFGASIRLA